ncbi:MAG TPA: PIN domain-containing protein [Aldersonia sp.]
MALIARYFLDTSAMSRIKLPVVARRIMPIIDEGLVATCAALDAEALFSSRNLHDYEVRRSDRRSAFEYRPTDDEHWQAALDAQRRLARTGRHRAVGIADLLVSVLAARHRLTVLHYDADYEVAATVVDFEQRWIAPRGSL